MIIEILWLAGALVAVAWLWRLWSSQPTVDDLIRAWEWEEARRRPPSSQWPDGNDSDRWPS